jgi:hypothetical protein
MSSAPVSVGGSEGIDGGSGALAGSLAEELEPPRSQSITLLSMRSMLQGNPAGR